jgi:hypothetical protein
MATYKIDTAALFKQTFGFAFQIEKSLKDKAVAMGSEFVSQQVTKVRGATIDKAFGYKIPADGLPDRAIDYRADVYDMPEAELVSYLGTPILMPVVLGEKGKGISYKSRDKWSGKIVDRKIEKEYTMPATTVVEISRQKNIIKTPIAGRDGSVKEAISNGDWLIKIRGFVINEQNPNVYPSDEMQTLHKYCEAKTAIPITCKLLQYFEINEVVIDSYNFPRMEGYAGVQPFELDCLSDEPLELIIKLAQSGL